MRNPETTWEAPAHQVGMKPAVLKPLGKYVVPSYHTPPSPAAQHFTLGGRPQLPTCPREDERTGPDMQWSDFSGAVWGTYFSILPESEYWVERAPCWEPLRTKVMVWTSARSLVTAPPPQLNAEWAKAKPPNSSFSQKQKLKIVRKDVEKFGHLCTVGSNAKWCRRCEKQYNSSSKS